MEILAANFGFWAMAGLISFGIGVWMLRAMARADQGVAADAGTKALALYRDQLAEVERDLSRGVLAEAEAAPLRTEIQRRMLDSARLTAAAPAPSTLRAAYRPARPMLGFAAILLTLAGGFALYLNLGNPGYPDLPLAQRLAAAQAAYDNRPTQSEAEAAAPLPAPVQATPEFLDLVAQLRRVVAQRPTDIQGLTLLAQNEAYLGNYPAAARAQQAILATKGDAAQAEDYLNTAQALILAAGGMISAEAEAALTATLQRDPDNGLAQYYSGLLFAQTGRPDRAFALWEPLINQGPPDAPWLEQVAQMLPALADAAGIRYTPPEALSQLAGPSAADMAAAEGLSAGERATMINMMVTGLEERLLSTGGSAEEWQRLITSLVTLGETGRLRTALAAGRAALKDDPTGLAAFEKTAKDAGLAP